MSQQYYALTTGVAFALMQLSLLTLLPHPGGLIVAGVLAMAIPHLLCSYCCSYWPAQRKKDVEQREVQRRLDELQQSARPIERALESVREEERTRIARDLHDDLGQTLTAIKLELGLLLEDEKTLNALQRDKLRRLVTIVDGSVDQIRDIATNLRPSLLDHVGFMAAIQGCVQEVNQRLNAEVVLTAGPGREIPLPDETAIALYRILQEALTNVSRHARAQNVRVHYAAPDNQPRLEVSDDGVGFRPGDAERAGTLGLLGLRERAAQLGGKLSVQSAPGLGCTIIVELPERDEKHQNRPC